jgi:hypothetical protein
MCRYSINWNAIRQNYWILAAIVFSVILILSLIKLSILRQIDTSNKNCDGPFNDTVSLNVKEHENFYKFNEGLCEDQTLKRYSRQDDRKFPFIARLVAKHQQNEIFCGGSLITSKFT